MSDNKQNSTLNGAVEDFFNTGNKSKVVSDSTNLKAEMVKKPDDSLDQMVPPDYAKVIHAEEPKETAQKPTETPSEEYHGLVTDDDMKQLQKKFPRLLKKNVKKKNVKKMLKQLGLKSLVKTLQLQCLIWMTRSEKLK